MKIKQKRKPCKCGCGEKPKQSKSQWIRGHNKGWGKGIVKKTSIKRFLISVPGHPRGTKSKYSYVFRNILVAEKALGKYLNVGHPVHHADGDTYNDSPSNLVICENQSYHKLLHTREKARDACGNVHWRRCQYCKEYDDLKNLVRSGYSHHHKLCLNKHSREKGIGFKRLKRNLIIKRRVKVNE